MMKAQHLLEQDYQNMSDHDLEMLHIQIVEKTTSYRGRIKHMESALKSVKSKLNVLKTKRSALEDRKIAIEKLQFERAGKVKTCKTTKGAKKSDLAKAINLLSSMSKEEINKLLEKL